jgi:hypothetical protein
MRIGLRFLTSIGLLAGTSCAWGNAEIHVSTFGDTPDLIELHFEDRSPPLRLHAPHGFITPAHGIRGSQKASLYGVPTETSPIPIDMGEIALPATGRHLLLVSKAESGKPLIKLLPFDRHAHPPGGVGFLNLTDRKIRCSLNSDPVELTPGENRLHKNIDPARRILNHRLESWDKKGWNSENATTLILGANKRFLLVFFQTKPGGEIQRKLVTDFDPERNLAPLEPAPVKAEPPLPDPPAK